MDDFKNIARFDFDRAYWKAFWRKIFAFLTGQRSELLPFDEVRQRLPMKGQRYVGLRQVPLSQVVGSVGRYRDFDRAFLPLQQRTRDRWQNIDVAHLKDVTLPPIEVIKIDEVYFVKDGNHRVSVARERGQEFIDAVVIEIDIPVPLPADTQMDDLQIKQEQAHFLGQTRLDALRPANRLEANREGQFSQLLEHITVHQYFMQKERARALTIEEAACSWFDNVYQPIITLLRENEILEDFPGVGEIDLYLWVVKYQWYLTQAYRADLLEEEGEQRQARETAARIAGEAAPARIRRLIAVMKKSPLMEDLLLRQERAAFEEKTRLAAQHPETPIEVTTPGEYERLYEHILHHRWYLGVQQQREIPIPEAASLWLEQIYLPFTALIDARRLLAAFPGRSAADLVLWILEYREKLKAAFGEEISPAQAVEQFAETRQPAADDDDAELLNPIPPTFQG